MHVTELQASRDTYPSSAVPGFSGSVTEYEQTLANLLVTRFLSSAAIIIREVHLLMKALCEK